MELLLTPKVLYVVCAALPVLWYLSGCFFVAGRARRNAAQNNAVRERRLVEAEGALVPKQLLTPNEREFFGRLQAAARPLALEVVPQVSMGALLDISLPEDHPLYWPMRKKFAMKIIDFVVYTKAEMQVLAVIELDDVTHDKRKDQRRDAMMAKAGFKTVRWESRAKPSVQTITQEFRRLLAGPKGA